MKRCWVVLGIVLSACANRTAPRGSFALLAAVPEPRCEEVSGPQGPPLDSTVTGICARANAHDESVNSRELVEARAVLRRLCGYRRCAVQLQARSFQERDLIAHTCHREKVVAIEQALRVAVNHQSLLQDAIARNEPALRGHEQAVLEVLAQRGRTLIEEARYCVAESVVASVP